MCSKVLRRQLITDDEHSDLNKLFLEYDANGNGGLISFSTSSIGLLYLVYDQRGNSHRTDCMFLLCVYVCVCVCVCVYVCVCVCLDTLTILSRFPFPII